MTQNNLYMESDEYSITVNVEPIIQDVLENSKNEAVASAASATQSAESAAEALNGITNYKRSLENFYAQASDNLTTLLNNSILSLNSCKQSILNNIQDLNNTVLTSINNTFNQIKNTIQTLGQNYVNQAKYYADAAQDTVDNRVSLEHLNQSKALETGDVSNDPDVLPWIKKIAHSTFDASKFTVEGSPIVTSDGIASGFSALNYIKKTSLTYTPVNELKITNRYIFGNGTSYEMPYMLKDDNSSIVTVTFSQNKIGLFKENLTGYKDISYNFTKGDVIDYTLTITPTTQIFDFSVNGVAQEQVINTSSYTFTQFSWVSIAGNINTITGQLNNICTGSIDLKQFSITVDGVEVFSGNRTGIDTIKSDDNTVVGTPTISDDGILSNANVSNYITANVDVTNKSFKIKLRVKTPVSFASSVTYISFKKIYNNVTYIGYININTYGSFVVSLNNGSGMYITSGSLSESTLYEVEVELTSTKLSAKYNTIGGTPISLAPLPNTTDINTNGLIPTSLDIVFGRNINDTATTLSTALIDLSAFKAYVDGDLVYQPCLKIPYTESKTGSKVVNAVYRSRVDDMYDEFGYAPYYTLSDADFTSPKGEIYGMIERLRTKINELSS